MGGGGGGTVPKEHFCFTFGNFLGDIQYGTVYYYSKVVGMLDTGTVSEFSDDCSLRHLKFIQKAWSFYFETIEKLPI